MADHRRRVCDAIVNGTVRFVAGLCSSSVLWCGDGVYVRRGVWACCTRSRGMHAEVLGRSLVITALLMMHRVVYC